MRKRISYFGLVLAALSVYLLGLGITVMDVDSAQYASISYEMAETGEYLQVKHHGNDYLDKPPLMFWVNAFFFKLFGVSDWVFKLGSFLFSILCFLSTYKIGKLLYGARVGRVAALVLFCSQAFFLINNDVRTDTMLIGAVAFSIWQLLAWFQTRRWLFFFGASLGIALAMLAKGPIGLMVPAIALASWLIGKSRWKDFFRWEYLLMLLVVLVLLSPMLYGLYQQFDAQPEKEITFVSEDGNRVETGVSGIKFYFWTQSFGRITGENVWRNNSGPFFFVHNFLWSFLPWSLLFIPAFFQRLFHIFRKAGKGEQLPELLTPLGFLIPFLVLSTSTYKLPHYVFVLYPLASIMLAQWLLSRFAPEKKAWFTFSVCTQLLVALVSLAFLGFIHFYVFTGFSVFWLSCIAICAGLSLLYFIQIKAARINLVYASAWMSVAVNLAMNSHFYPRLMEYQAGSQIAEELKMRNLGTEQVHRYDYYSFSLMYYIRGNIKGYNDRKIERDLEQDRPVYMLCYQSGFEDLSQHFTLNTVRRFDTFNVTQLSMPFLNPDTRKEALTPVYLVKILGKK